MDKSFHVLGRNSAGGLTTATKQYVKDAGVALEFKTAKTASAAEVLREFRNVLPKSVILPASTPFLILRALRPVGGSLAECKCMCSSTSDCGGGGGGR